MDPSQSWRSLYQQNAQDDKRNEGNVQKNQKVR
jgi:hypothetical protein